MIFLLLLKKRGRGKAIGCPVGGVLCRAQGTSMNLPSLPLQLPQINKGKQVMALKAPFLSFFFLSYETSVEIVKGGPNPAAQESAAVPLWAAGFANPQQRSYFCHFLNATATKQSPSQTLLSCSSACVESSGWEWPLEFEHRGQLS